jgi:hypothetical protein
MALGCVKQAPLTWATPAMSAAPEAPCTAAGADLTEAFAQGIAVSGERAAALFPDLALEARWVERCEIRSFSVQRCGDQVVLIDPELRFESRRGELLDVAIITDALVHPRNILTLRRTALRTPPPTGAWLAPERTVLRHVGPVAVGQVEAE